MTVNPAKERRDKRRAGQGPKGLRTYRRTFLVTTDVPTTAANEILTATGLPSKLVPYQTENEFDPKALVVGISLRQLSKTALHWEVEYKYSTDVDKEEEEEEEDENPESVPAVVTFGFENFRVIARTDVGGEDPLPILSSSEQPFTPPPMIDDSRPILTVERNQLIFNPLQAIDFQNAVNKDPFIGAEAGQVKVKGITATKEIQVGNPEKKFWRVTYIFVFNRDGWKLRIADVGTRVKDEGGVEFKPYLENLILTEISLDGFGNKLADGANVVIKKFDVYKTRNFAELGIDQTLGIGQ